MVEHLGFAATMSALTYLGLIGEALGLCLVYALALFLVKLTRELRGRE